MHQTSTERAFTLVELAIVLVIIGLLVGGVMVGRDLISAAEMRSQINQFNEISQAAGAFINKYSCAPGDCRTATRFFNAASQPDRVSNGNGDGWIRTNFPGSIGQMNTGWEVASVFDHLAASGLFNFQTYDESSAVPSNYSGVGYPVGKLPLGRHSADSNNKGMGIMVGDFGALLPVMPAGRKIILGICGTSNNKPGGNCGPTPIQALDMDTKLDDGLPYTGSMRVIGTGEYISRIGGYGGGDDTTACATYATNIYKNTGTNQDRAVCPLAIHAQF